jgi:TetR/AcrR family tetracycline transcriptional repressor
MTAGEQADGRQAGPGGRGESAAAEGSPVQSASASAGASRAAAARVSASRAGIFPPSRWGREPGVRPRADKPVLSRESIVRTAIRIVDEEGFEAVSMRRVAQELGTGAASLYAYVANKDELMDLILDEVMGESAVEPQEPAADVAEWQEQLKATVRASYRALSAHRDIARAFLGRIPFGPNGLRTVESMLGLLRAHGMPDYVAAYAGDLIGQYVVSTSIEDYVWRQRYPEATREQVSETMVEVGDYLEALPKEEFPHLTAMARTITDPDPESPLADRFELGLDILVRGLTAFLPARPED